MARPVSWTLMLLLALGATVLLVALPKAAGARYLFPTGRNSSTPPRRPCFVDSILAFGDSTSDTGNAIRTGNPSAQLAANPPYGMDFDVDVHGRGRPSGRFCDGRLMLDFLSEALGLPLVPPHLARAQPKHQSAHSPSPSQRHTMSSGSSDNFAVAGATALEPSLLKKLANATSLTPYSLTDELGWLHEAVRHHRVSNKTLVYFGEIGGNDYNYAFTAQYAGQQQQPHADVFRKLIPKVVHEIHTALKQILKAGVTHVIVQGDFPMGCMPVYLRQAKAASHRAPAAAPIKGLFDAHGCVATVSAVSDEHNLRLRQVVHELQAAHPHARLVFFDTAAAYLHVLHHASAYGFTNTTEPCVDLGNLLTSSPHPANPAAPRGLPRLSACPKPRKYMSWDGIHLTDAMYKAMMRLFLGLDRRAGAPFSSPPLNFLTSPAAACRVTKPL